MHAEHLCSRGRAANGVWAKGGEQARPCWHAACEANQPCLLCPYPGKPMGATHQSFPVLQRVEGEGAHLDGRPTTRRVHISLVALSLTFREPWQDADTPKSNQVKLDFAMRLTWLPGMARAGHTREQPGVAGFCLRSDTRNVCLSIMGCHTRDTHKEEKGSPLLFVHRSICVNNGLPHA
eukprot:1160301-Pelagomonas_calceolata.AAC.2